MADYTPQSWTDGQSFTSSQATAISQAIGKSYLKVHHDFTKDTALPATVDSGQALTLHRTSQTPTVTITGGLLVTNASTGGFAFYTETEADTDIVYLSGRGKFSPGGTAGAAVCIGVFNHSIAGGTNNIGSPAHIVVQPTQVDYGVFLGGNGTGPDNFKIQSFTYPDAGADEWFIEAAWNPKTGEAAVRDPSGKAHKVTNPDVLQAVDIPARFAFAEIKYDDAATNKRVGIAGFGADDASTPAWASTSRGAALLAEANSPTPTQVVAWRKAKSSANTGAKSVSALANIATDLDVTFTAPPSGSVVYTIGCTIDTATAMDIGLVANTTGAGLAAAYTQSSEIAPGRRRHQATIIQSGLTPGATYSVTPQTYTGGDAQIIIDAPNFDSAIIVVEPVVEA